VRTVGGGAIVLAGLGDAVALFLFIGGGEAEPTLAMQTVARAAAIRA
jgi:hypothetical protein